jgi:hypothetical protein
LLTSCHLQPAFAQQISIGAWGPNGGVSFSNSPYGTSVNIVVPGGVVRYSEYNWRYRYYGYPQVVVTPPVYVQPQVVYVERQAAPDGYYETGRACHANIVCINGSCYRCY